MPKAIWDEVQDVVGEPAGEEEFKVGTKRAGVKAKDPANRKLKAPKARKVSKAAFATDGADGAAGPPSKFEVPPLVREHIVLKIVGLSPLIMHKWSEKAKRMILDKQMGVATSGRARKDPVEDYEQSIYRLPNGRPCFPAIAFKAAAVTACSSLPSGITKVAARQAFHIEAEMIEIVGEPEMDEQMVRVGIGTADIRYRAKFVKWSASLPLSFNPAIISGGQLANLMQHAGSGVGIGEHRPEKNGDNGRFEIDFG